MDYISIISEEVDLASSYRYMRLPHPRTGQAQMYLPYATSGKDGLCEVVKVSGSKGRTWFIDDDKIDAGSILIHHPIDPLFLVIPIIMALLPSDSSIVPPFQPLSDLLSTASALHAFSLRPAFTSDAGPRSTQENPDVARLLEMKSVRRAFRACCERKTVPDTVVDEASGSNDTKPSQTSYFRPSRDLVLFHLRAKVAHLARPEHFEKFDHLVRGLSRDGLLATGVDANLVEQARSRAAIDHVAQYIPSNLLTLLIESYDLSALQTHQANVTAAALAASQPVHKSESKGSGAGAKRKAPATSKGVEALKKVNTGGMSKLTSFFKPKQ